MEIKIRLVEEKDLGRVKDLLSQVCMVHHLGRPDWFKIGRKYRDEELLELFKNETRPIFVAADEDDIVQGYAFCIFEEHKNDNVLMDMKTIYIDDLCVEESKRGMHIGKQLYEYVKKYAKENGFYNVTLNVWECNPGARKFYESLGLKPLKTYMEEIL